MQISLQLLAIVPLLLESVSGAASQSCRTELGTKSIKNVPTAWSTTTKKPATKTLLAEQKTVTTYKGFVSTKTKTVTSTKVVTNKAITDTFSSTATSFEVSTITVPATVTETETSTSTEQSVSTTVIPTAAGFRMIQDTINSEDLLGPRGLDLGHPHGDVDKRASKTVKKDGGVQAFVYPNRVDCTKTMNNKVTKTSWKTLAPATETYAYWSKTSTKTKTQWRTSTKIPANVPTTIVDTSTSSVTTYTTTFETQTEQTSTTTTEVLPGPTVYDSCAQGNYFGPNFFASGQNYFAVNVANNGPGVASDFKTVADGATTATECCNACQRFANCETFLFRARNKNCFLLYHEGGVCQGQSRHPNFILSRQGVDTGAGYVVGNGNCGYTYSGNSDGSVFPVNNFP